MEISKILIYGIHAPLGALALVAGAIALFAKKGSTWHKRSGKVFFFSMVCSALSSLLICLIPEHQSAFLFSMGCFSLYFLVLGMRSLQYKQNKSSYFLDRSIAIAMVILGVTMIGYPVFLYRVVHLILAVFGTLAILFGLRFYVLTKDPVRLQKQWLQMHLGNMTGAYISTMSAFLVVNQVLPGVWNWFVPSIVGGCYIAYWITAVNKQKASQSL